MRTGSEVGWESVAPNVLECSECVWIALRDVPGLRRVRRAPAPRTPAEIPRARVQEVGIVRNVLPVALRLNHAVRFVPRAVAETSETWRNPKTPIDVNRFSIDTPGNPGIPGLREKLPSEEGTRDLRPALGKINAGWA